MYSTIGLQANLLNRYTNVVSATVIRINHDYLTNEFGEHDTREYTLNLSNMNRLNTRMLGV